MAMKHYAKPIGGSKTSFVWGINQLSGCINLKRNGKTVALTGIGGTTAGKTISLGVYGTSADNLSPSHVGSGLTHLKTVTVSTSSEKQEVDVSGYERFVIHAVYGSGTVGTGNNLIYMKIEN